MANQEYAVIVVTAGTYDGVAAVAGQVINRVMWDGVSEWTPQAGTEARADPNGTLQIGSTTTV